MSEAPLLPVIDEDAAPFYAAARRGELRIPRCSETGRLFFPPRPRSPFAPRSEPGWVTVSGRGTIWSFVVAHPPLLPAFQAHAPYPVITVALEEDPTLRLVGNVVARPGGPIGEVDPSSLRIGAGVEVSFERISDEIALPRWLLT